MIKVGNTYKSGAGHVVTVTAICGKEIYYSDEFGCHFHKIDRHFAGMYIGSDAYYALKADRFFEEHYAIK